MALLLRTAMLYRLRSPFLRGRAFSQGSGRVLSEEEKAAENVYIKKMEQERLEKLARKGAHPEQKADATAGGSGASSSEGVSRDTTKNYAVVAGVVTIVAGVWWYLKSGSKKTETHA